MATCGSSTAACLAGDGGGARSPSRCRRQEGVGAVGADAGYGWTGCRVPLGVVQRCASFGGGTVALSTFGKFIQSTIVVLLPIQIPILDLDSEITNYLDLDSEIHNGDL